MSEKIRALIIEDDPSQIEVLQELLTECCPNVTVIGTARSVKSAISLIRTSEPDLVFLDIRLPDGTGFDILDTLGIYSFEVVVFTSEGDQYAPKAFKIKALHYLEKPVTMKDLIESVRRVENSLQNRLAKQGQQKIQESIPIPVSEKKMTRVCNPDEVIVIIGEGSYTTYCLTDNEKIVVRSSISECLDRLALFPCFLQTAKNYIVNTRHITGFSKGQSVIYLTNGHTASIGDKFKKDFLNRYRSL